MGIAKAIARGDATYEVPYEDGTAPVAYAAIVQAIAGSWPVMTFVPANATVYLLGLKLAETSGQTLRTEAERIQADAHDVHQEASAYLDMAGASVSAPQAFGR